MMIFYPAKLLAIKCAGKMCLDGGIRYKRYRQHHGGSDNSNTGFVKLQIEKPAATGAVEIHFPGGIRLLFHEPVSSNYLKALIS